MLRLFFGMFTVLLGIFFGVAIINPNMIKQGRVFSASPHAGVRQAPVELILRNQAIKEAKRFGIDPETMPIVESGTAQIPHGHIDYCRRHAWDCKRNSRVARLRMTEDLKRLIYQVNVKINAKIRPAKGDLDGQSTDRLIFGKDEHWAYTEEEGDCEDIVLKKRYLLIKQGIPPSALLLTVVSVANNGIMDHMVLTVRTDKGDYVMNNLTNDIWKWYHIPYQIISRQSPIDRRLWDPIVDTRASLLFVSH